LYLTTGASAAVGTAAALWPLIDTMNPSADVLALSTVEVDLEASSPASGSPSSGAAGRCPSFTGRPSR
jgi:ubiquinol-cytochrome c reductase iron-sulfur subunit